MSHGSRNGTGWRLWQWVTSFLLRRALFFPGRGLHPPSLKHWCGGSVKANATALRSVILLAIAVSANGLMRKGEPAMSDEGRSMTINGFFDFKI